MDDRIVEGSPYESHCFFLDGTDLKNHEKKSEFRLGSAFFGISDPGLVKKTFFESFLSEKLTRGP